MARVVETGRPDPSGERARAAIAVAGSGALLFLVTAFAAPLMERSGLPTVASLIRAAYRPVCHQIPGRCLDVVGHPAALCARCTGIYFGGSLGLLLALVPAILARVRPSFSWLALAAAPVIVDVACGLVFEWGLPMWPRLATAVPAGLASGLFLSVGLAEMLGGGP